MRADTRPPAAAAPGSDHGAGASAPAQPPAQPRPQRGDQLELEVSALAYGGEGVARFGEGGYVVFVAGAVPGDRVRAVVHKRKRSYAHARAVELLRASPQRIPPRASHPGVPWQVLPYERQLQIKQEQVADALARLGGLRGFELLEIAPALEQWRYRNKLEYSFAGAAGEGLVCGFHAGAGAGEIAEIEDCLLASERGNLARELALGWCREQRLEPWPRTRGREPLQARAQRVGPAVDGRARLRNLVVREGRRSGQLQVRLVTSAGELDAGAFAAVLARGLSDQLSGVLWTRSHSPAETTAGGETELVWGERELPERLCELELRISPEAFFQINTEMAELVYAQAAQFAALEGWERVYDLYCGIGTISLALAPRAGEVWGIELIGQAVADAAAAARRNGIGRVRFVQGDVRSGLRELLAQAGRPNVLVVDPPRAGLSKKVVQRIAEASPSRIVYVSCNPTTLAPNAAELVRAGYELRRVRPVDMFPQTPHVECVALLERAGAAAAGPPSLAGPRD